MAQDFSSLIALLDATATLTPCHAIAGKGEAFAQKYLGMTNKIKTRMLCPYSILDLWVKDSLIGRGLISNPLSYKERGLERGQNCTAYK
jgi:hypothetical protein